MTPKQRHGYSDRMAHLMAELSDLAYLKFEKTEPGSLKNLLEKIEQANEKEKLNILDSVICQKTNLHVFQNKQLLINRLNNLNFELVETFNHNAQDTQAYLAKTKNDKKFPGQKFSVLVFRGSEPKMIDWKTNFSIGDLRIKDGEFEFQIHHGFFTAFKEVQAAIEKEVFNLIKNGYKLYITGHSLGGALAIIATHQIGRKKTEFHPGHSPATNHTQGSIIPPDSIHACYTFGSPRVAGIGFAQSIKTPIYRVVNGDDVVPRLPPVYTPWILLQFKKILRIIPSVDRFVDLCINGLSKIVQLITRTTGVKLPLITQLLKISTLFVHHGDMRYICHKFGNGPIIILSNPDLFVRLQYFFRDCLKNPRSVMADHYIYNYIPMLRKYSQQRDSTGILSENSSPTGSE